MREREAIAAMMESTPPDDWDELDRSLFATSVLRSLRHAAHLARTRAVAVPARAASARSLRRAAGSLDRHPPELPPFAIDPRGRPARRGCAAQRRSGARNRRRPAPQPAWPRRSSTGPPAWIADEQGAYLLDATFDAARAERAILQRVRLSPRRWTTSRRSGRSRGSRRFFAPRSANVSVSRTFASRRGDSAMAWRRCCAVIRPLRSSTSLRRARPDFRQAVRLRRSAVASCGFRLRTHVRLPSDCSAAGFVPRFDGTFSLHGRRTRGGVRSRDAAALERSRRRARCNVRQRLHARLVWICGWARVRPSGGEDWFELDVDVLRRRRRAALRAEELARNPAAAGTLRRRARTPRRRRRAARSRSAARAICSGVASSGLAALVALARRDPRVVRSRLVCRTKSKRLRERVRNFAGIERGRAARALSGVLRDYQERGLDFLSYLSSFRFGGILADEMGVGKTVRSARATLLRT